MNTLAYDIETWSNAFYICFYDGNTAATFTHRNLDALRRFVTKDLVLVGYNNFGFDDILLRHILSTPSATAGSINDICKRIIGSRQLPDDLWKISYSPTPWAYSIDMYQVLSKSGTLKELECRNHMVCVEESPVSFDAPLDFAYELQVQKYNLIDVQATWELYQKNIHLIELRQGLIDTYGLTPKVFCKPDAGITKELAMHQYRERTGGWSSTAKKAADQAEDNRKREWQTSDLVAKNIKFQTDEFRLFFKFFMSCKLIGDDRGTTWKYADDAFKNPVTLGGKEYQIGVGGLHSIDAPGRFESSKDLAITDFDVGSYYPSLIITLGLYPSHIGPHSLKEYTRIRDQRIDAKKSGNKKMADMYKLLLNTYFGVLNEPTSPIRSIPCALKVTLNGQLQLLMLIERFEMLGCRVLSCNTDGVTVLHHRDQRAAIDAAKKAWEQDTGHELEEAEYAKYCRRDVNSYVVLKADGKVKTKGAYEIAPFKGKTDEAVVKQAAQDYLLKGVPIHETVRGCKKFTDFIYYQRVKNGGKLCYGGKESGTILRWYVAKEGLPVQRKNPDQSMDMIPNGHNAKLAMTLPVGMPVDINHSYYISEAKKLVEAITHIPKPRRKKD